MSSSAINRSHSTHLFNPMMARPVIIIGAGSIGSYTALALAKDGVPDITVIDGDYVASHNVGMSAYYPKHVGMLKVLALRELIHEQTGIGIAVEERFYQGERLRNATIISCVDRMEDGRHRIWKAVRGSPSVDLLVDSRTAAGYIEVYGVNPTNKEDIRKYEQTLFADTEAARQACGLHGLSMIAMRQAAAVSTTVIRFWQTGQKRWLVSERCDILERIV